MKANGTRSLLIVFILQLFLAAVSVSATAQPDYIFRNPVLMQGTANQVGAKYRFSNIKPGIDGIIEIKDSKGGMTLEAFDGGSGFDDAFQPQINCPAKKKGYIEFQLDLVQAGTTNAVFVTELPLTAIDIDGYEYPDEKIFETDEFEHTSNFYVQYDLVGTNLNVKANSGWTTATNTSAVNYPGVDTIQRDVMFTAVHGNVTKVLFRVGADNKSKESTVRLRSVYFRKFSYTNSFLAQSALLSLNGYEKNKKVQLNWTLAANHKLSRIFIEKAVTGNQFVVAGEVVFDAANAGQTRFTFADNSLLESTALYRLRMVMPSGSSQFSNILAFRNSGTADNNRLKLYPSVVQSGATISLKADRDGIAVIKVVDLSGRVVMQQSTNVQEGANNITLANADRLVAGNYIVAVQHDSKLASQKFIKQ